MTTGLARPGDWEARREPRLGGLPGAKRAQGPAAAPQAEAPLGPSARRARKAGNSLRAGQARHRWAGLRAGLPPRRAPLPAGAAAPGTSLLAPDAPLTARPGERRFPRCRAAPGMVVSETGLPARPVPTGAGL